MDWGVLVPAAVAAVSAVYGVGYGAKLAGRREEHNWTRDQRLKVYGELLLACENCYGSFALIAAHLDLAQYDLAKVDQKALAVMMKDWSNAFAEMDRHLGRAELVASDKLWPYLLGGVRHGTRGRHQFILMKLSTGHIDQAEWKHAADHTHGELLKLPRELREDIRRSGAELSIGRASTAWMRLRRLPKRMAHRFRRLTQASTRR